MLQVSGIFTEKHVALLEMQKVPKFYVLRGYGNMTSFSFSKWYNYHQHFAWSWANKVISPKSYSITMVIIIMEVDFYCT